MSDQMKYSKYTTEFKVSELVRGQNQAKKYRFTALLCLIGLVLSSFQRPIFQHLTQAVRRATELLFGQFA